jgi:hypothetical protein
MKCGGGACLKNCLRASEGPAIIRDGLREMKGEGLCAILQCEVHYVREIF